jgi:hypothetical protein
MGLGTRVSHNARQAMHQLQPWYSAYLDALFESDPAKIPGRVRVAEQMIATRDRELFRSRVDLSEKRALSNALQALKALRSCVQA